MWWLLVAHLEEVCGIFGGVALVGLFWWLVSHVTELATYWLGVGLRFTRSVKGQLGLETPRSTPFSKRLQESTLGDCSVDSNNFSAYRHTFAMRHSLMLSSQWTALFVISVLCCLFTPAGKQIRKSIITTY